MKLQGTVCVEGTTWELGAKKENEKQYFYHSVESDIFFVKETAGESILKTEILSWEISCKYISGQLCRKEAHDSTSKLELS